MVPRPIRPISAAAPFELMNMPFINRLMSGGAVIADKLPNGNVWLGQDRVKSDQPKALAR